VLGLSSVRERRPDAAAAPLAATNRQARASTAAGIRMADMLVPTLCMGGVSGRGKKEIAAWLAALG